MGFRFRKFKLYDEIRAYVLDMYKISDKLPKSELYGLSSQLKRASTSVLLNFSEGSMRNSDKEFARFMMIAIGSLSEVVAILDILIDQKLISTSIHNKYLVESETLAKKLYGFRRKLKS